MTNEVKNEVEEPGVEELFKEEVVEEKTEDEQSKEDTEAIETEGTKDKEETTEETPAEDKEDKPTHDPKLVHVAAVHDVRRKNAVLQEENEALRKRIPKTEEAPDPVDDIDAYDTFKKNQWQQEQRAEQDTMTRERLDKSRSQMLEQHNDYVEMEKIFEIMSIADPSLVGKMLNSGDEAKFAYDAAKTYKQELLGVTETVEKEKPSAAQKRNDEALDTPNLATATAQASNTTQLEKEESLDDLFDDDEW